MTEDDTFRILKRIPFSEMYRLWHLSTSMPNDPDVDQFFSQYGWTFLEYRDEFDRQIWENLENVRR